MRKYARKVHIIKEIGEDKMFSRMPRLSAVRARRAALVGIIYHTCLPLFTHLKAPREAMMSVVRCQLASSLPLRNVPLYIANLCTHFFAHANLAKSRETYIAIARMCHPGCASCKQHSLVAINRLSSQPTLSYRVGSRADSCEPSARQPSRDSRDSRETMISISISINFLCA